MNEKRVKYWVEARILDKADGSVYYKIIGIEAPPNHGQSAMAMAHDILIRERSKGEIFINRLKVVSIENEGGEAGDE